MERKCRLWQQRFIRSINASDTFVTPVFRLVLVTLQGQYSEWHISSKLLARECYFGPSRVLRFRQMQRRRTLQHGCVRIPVASNRPFGVSCQKEGRPRQGDGQYPTDPPFAEDVYRFLALIKY